MRGATVVALSCRVPVSGNRNPATVSTMDRDRHDARSKVLFGNEHMLTVATHIAAGGDIFTTAEVCDATKVPRTSVHRLLGTLVEVDVLRRLPRSSAERLQWYSRLPHPFWGAVQALAEVGLDAQTGSQAADGRAVPGSVGATAQVNR